MSLVYMKVLESSSSRYDRGIQMITGGKISLIYQTISSQIEANYRVLDIGSGTGNLAILAAQKGAKVKAIDINPEMLSIARDKTKELGLEKNVDYLEMSIAELDSEQEQSYDLILAGLCFSELSYDERVFTLRQIQRVLKPDGTFILVDEVKPKGFFKTLHYYMIRLPLVLITYLLTQTSTQTLKNIESEIESYLVIEESTRHGTLLALTCRRSS